MFFSLSLKFLLLVVENEQVKCDGLIENSMEPSFSEEKLYFNVDLFEVTSDYGFVKEV